MKVTAPVFRDNDGNRYIFPAHIHDPAKGDGERREVINHASMVAHAMRGQCVLEDRWLEFDSEAFLHAKGVADHPCFEDGPEEILIFEGPLFGPSQRH